eukprot:6204637-Pleurochrysis_carterae.AAC.2
MTRKCTFDHHKANGSLMRVAYLYSLEPFSLNFSMGKLPQVGFGVGLQKSNLLTCSTLRNLSTIRVYFKVHADGNRVDLVLYVDDCWFTDTGGFDADSDLQLFGDKFKLVIEDNPKQFSGMKM